MIDGQSRNLAEAELQIVTASSRKLINNENKIQNPIKPPLAQNLVANNMKSSPVSLEFENSKFKMSSLTEENLKPKTNAGLIEEERRKSLNNNDKDSQFMTSSNLIPAIFHPSKINMASTPIRSNRVESM